MIAKDICLYHAEDLLEMRRSTMCIADRTVHSKLGQLLDIFGPAGYQLKASVSLR